MTATETMESIKDALVSELVAASPDLLEFFGTDASGGSGAVPLSVVKPASTEQVAALIKWARQSGTPLVPISSKAPHHRGDTLLDRPGVIVDMSGFERIIMINRRNRVALFEAGVGFQKLALETRAAGLRAMMPLLPRPGKSALAAYLEREPTIYPRYQWDLADPLLCLEIVWGTGDIFRTGSAAGPGSLDQQWRAGEYQKSPMGPGQNDWSRIVQGAQGCMAVVTWCSAKCEIRSPREELSVVSCDRLEPLVRASYDLFHDKLTDVHFMLDAEAMLKLMAADEGAREEARKRVRPWSLIYSISGLAELPEERMALFKKRADKILVHPV